MKSKQIVINALRSLQSDAADAFRDAQRLDKFDGDDFDCLEDDLEEMRDALDSATKHLAALRSMREEDERHKAAIAKIEADLNA